jgi:DNA-binding PadR family transcriptional regulator
MGRAAHFAFSDLNAIRDRSHVYQTYRNGILARYMTLSPTARVILGMIRLGRRTGYEIKQLVDVSARFFWAASYGQIYPELKRLEEAGLIESVAEPQGGRRRREYGLTPAGERALDEWLASDGDLVYEVRDEGILKLFFSDSLEPGQRIELLRRMRAHHQEIVDRLGAIEPAARERGGGPYMTLRSGMRLHRAYAEIYQELERELEAEFVEKAV